MNSTAAVRCHHSSFIISAGLLLLCEFQWRFEAVGFFDTCLLFFGEKLIEFSGSVFRHAQRYPFRRFEMLREKNDLAYVVGVMCKLAIDRLDYRMRFAAYRYGFREIYFA